MFDQRVRFPGRAWDTAPAMSDWSRSENCHKNEVENPWRKEHYVHSFMFIYLVFPDSCDYFFHVYRRVTPKNNAIDHNLVVKLKKCISFFFRSHFETNDTGWPQLPSGKLTVCYWKWPFSSLIHPWKMVIFHSYVNVYQRVSHHFPIQSH